jgi:hypothetical protein
MRISAFALSLIALGTVLNAQTLVRGVVRSTDGAPLPGSQVHELVSGRSVVSNIDGVYVLRDLAPGRAVLGVQRIGFRTRLDTLDLQKGTNQHDIILAELSYTLRAFDVHGTMESSPRDVMTRSLTTSDVIGSPGAAEDVMRALHTMPGVVAPNDFTASFSVRGAAPSQNTIIIDGIEVRQPYRLWGGVSMFNPETIRDVRFYPGGFPARFGDALSAAIEVDTRNGSRTRLFQGAFSMGLAAATVVCEGPVSLIGEAVDSTDDTAEPPWNGSWMAAVRRTYYDLLAAPLIKSAGVTKGNSVLPNFIDFQFKLDMQTDVRNAITILGMSSRDEANLTTGTDISTLGNLYVEDISFSSLVALTWTHAEGDRLMARTILSYSELGGSDEFSGDMIPSVSSGLNMSTEEFERLQDSLRRAGLPVYELLHAAGRYRFLFRDVSIRSSTFMTVSDKHALDAGMALNFVKSELDIGIALDPRLIPVRLSNPRNAALPSSFSSKAVGIRVSAWGQDAWTPAEGLRLEPGVRAEYFELLRKAYLSPRFSASWKLHPMLEAHGSLGIYYQSPGFEKQFSPGYNAYLVQTLYDLSNDRIKSLKAEQSVHSSFGIMFHPVSDVEIVIDAYNKSFSDLVAPKVVTGTRYVVDRIGTGDPLSPQSWSAPYRVPVDSITTEATNSASGKAYGLEVSVRSPPGVEFPVSFAVAYSLSFAERTWAGHTYPFDYDRRHSLTIDVGWRITGRVDATLRWTYGSGLPLNSPVGIRPRVYLKTDTVTGISTPALDVDSKGVVFDYDRGGLGNLGKSRLPDYHRLDVRVNYHTDWFGWDWSLYLEVINVYNHLNVSVMEYGVDRNTMRIREIPLSSIPILPSIGVRVRL